MRRLSLAAPALAWQRRCCASPPGRKVIQLCGDYIDRYNGQRGWTLLKDDGSVMPVSKWDWKFARQFTELAHAPTLALPKADTMLPAMRVFAALDIDERILREWKPPRNDNVYDHCKIEEVMKQLGLMPELNIHAPLAASDGDAMLAQFQQMRDEVNKILSMRDEVKDILKANRNVVSNMSETLQLDETAEYLEKKVDDFARAFVMLCGFNDSPFKITSQAGSFKIFDNTCRSVGDFYVVLSKKGDLVLVVEDKAERKQGEPHNAILKQGHLGQIVGELLQVLSTNRDNGVYRSVFAVRFINHHVAAFRVDPERQTLDTLVDTRYVPDRKLQLLCSEPDPTVDRGWSLVDKAQRQQALQAMADIRNYILSQ